MPMNVTITLLAPQRQNINTFRFDSPPHGFCNLIYASLQGKIFLDREIACYLFLVLNGGNQHVSIERGIFVEESYKQVIPINNMILVGSPIDHFTYKAWLILNSIYIGI